MFEVGLLEKGRGALARSILTALPEWFGIPESIDAYVTECDTLPVFAASTDGRQIGFLAIKAHTTVAAEAYVAGVLREWHRQGCGRLIFAAAERHLAQRGFRYLTVKTLAPSDPDPHYAATRAFYERIGFAPIEVFPTLWNEDNPCLLMLKPIATR